MSNVKCQMSNWRKGVVIALTLLSGSAFGIFHTGWHDAGLLTVKLSNYGTFGSENAGIWPRGSSESYIFGAGIWIGALQPAPAGTHLTANVDSLANSLPVNSLAGFDSTRGFFKIGDELVHYRATGPNRFDSCTRGFGGSRPAAHVNGDSVSQMAAHTSVGYDPSTGYTELSPGDLPNEPGYTDTLDRIYFSTNPADTALWPVRRPNGDALVVSNQDSYNVANDLDPARCPGPLGIKIIQKGYSWYYHYYEDFLFFTYLIVNTSPTDSLKNLFSGVCCDADIGDATDDLVGSDPSRNLGYAWDSNFQEAGWTHVPGYIGFDFLESPLGPSGQLGLTAFKILHNPGNPGPGVPDPASDLEAYLTVAGYDHPTGRYHPTDSIAAATDVRFVQCTGPFNLAPLDTGRIVIAVIYGADSLDLRGNSDLAQRLYDSHYITHRAWVLDPNGHEEISGDYTVRWRDSSATGGPLLADIGCTHNGGKTWQDIVTNIPSTGSYDWNTRLYPDGTRYLVRVTVHDTIAVGEDVADTTFTVNNPGNGTPDVVYLSPQNGVIRGSGTVHWYAADPDHDTLAIDLAISTDSINWTTFVSDLPNTGSYDWDTRRFNNGSYYLQVRARDRDTFAFDHSGATVDVMNDHRSVGTVSHVAGGCNSLSLLALQYDSTAYTGHTYQVNFDPLIRNPSMPEPFFRYNLRDETGETLLLADVGLNIRADGQLYTQFSPIVDGFALEFDTRVDQSGFRWVDFHEERNRSGFDGHLIINNEDSLGTAPPMPSYEWAFRGADYVLRWTRVTPPDSLTIEVYDSTNRVYIPFERVRGDNWQFGSGGRATRFFNPTTHRGFYLSGGYFNFNQNNEMTQPPDTGDVWVIRSAGHRVPCAGNIWQFMTPTGIAEANGATSALRPGLRLGPNPARARVTINYVLPLKQRTAIDILDISGRRVGMLQDGIRAAGRYSLEWNGTDARGKRLGSGIYFVRLLTAQTEVIEKVVLIP
jgi:hypothetical protein